MNGKIKRNSIKKSKIALHRYPTRNVLKALKVIMENNQNQNSAQPTREVVKPNEEIQSEFYNTGRIGRRNALGDILKNEHCTTNTADSQSFVSTFEKNCVLTTKPEPGSNGNSSGINQQPNESSNK